VAFSALAFKKGRQYPHRTTQQGILGLNANYYIVYEPCIDAGGQRDT